MRTDSEKNIRRISPRDPTSARARMATGYDGAEISQADIDGWSSWLLPAEVLKDSPSRSDGVSEDLERT